MRRLLATVLLAVSAAVSAQAQPTPFPMAPGAEPARSEPTATSRATAPLPFDMGGPRPIAPPLNPAPAGAVAPNRAAAPARAPIAVPPVSRFVLPAEVLRLQGETDARSWSIFVTQDEAAQDTSLAVSFTNSIFVMPEASRLRVSLNGEVVLDAAIESPGGVRTITVPVRRSLLRAGQNRLRFEAAQRHRVDCSIDATYELWTQIDGATTGLRFGKAAGPRLRTLDDLPAAGIDREGKTTLHAVVPELGAGRVGNLLLRATQAVAIRGRYQHLVVKVADALPAVVEPGTLPLVIGTTSEIAGLIRDLPSDSMSRPWAGFARTGDGSGEVLVVTGATGTDLEAAVEMLAQPTLRPAGVVRGEMDTTSWSAPDAPLFATERSVRLANIDVANQEFSGRRFSTTFKVALPSDFYAEGYGQAILALDAAYATAVRPGSHLDVYVNGRITATLALNAGHGGLLQRFPLQLSLRNFRPGVNDVVIEAFLLTDSDAQCVPGATIPGQNRFALFETTELTVPNYARIGRFPNLSALSATGYPYQTLGNTVAVVLGRHDAAHYAAAATFLARIAHSAGRPIPIDTGVTMLSIGNRPAFIVGTAGQLAPSVLSVAGIADNARTVWPNAIDAPSMNPAVQQTYDAVVDRFRAKPGSEASNPDDDGLPMGTEDIRNRWRQSLGRGMLGREVSSIGDWLDRTFDFSFTTLNLFDRPLAPYEPAPQTSVILAQGHNPQGDAPWTVLVGRRADVLEQSVAQLTDREIWQGLSGQLAAFQPQTLRLVTRAAGRTEFIQTRPLSLENTRQIIANWLSTNIAFYAVLLIFLCTFLGVATSIMLKGLGRP